jgi:LysM repeat protein
MKKVTKPFNGNFAITQKFGVKVAYMRSGMHNGIDYGMPKGTELIACFDGIIRDCEKWNLTGYGKNFKIEAHDGKTIAHYAHCSEILVNNGTRVKRGDVLAKSGNTGYVISLGGGGYHLHFGIMYKKNWIDPLTLMDGYNLGLDTSETTSQKIEVKNEDIEEYLVEKGDTLSKIAKARLGNGNRWTEILEINRDVIENKNKILAGMKLKIPKK